MEYFLNCREYLREKLPIITEAFVKFYGEDKRKEIEDKFSHILLVAHNTPQSRAQFLKDLQKQITKEIIDAKMSAMNPPLSKEDLFQGYDLENRCLTPIDHYHVFYEMFKLGEEGRQREFKEKGFEDLKRYIKDFTREEFEEIVRTKRVPEKYKTLPHWLRENMMYYADPENMERRYQSSYKTARELIEKIDSNITLDNFPYYLDSPKIKSLNEFSDALEEIEKEYEERLKKYSKYYEEQKQNEEVRRKLQAKYYIRLVEENSDFLEESDKATLEEYRKDSFNSFRLSEKITFIFGYGLTPANNIESFSKEAETLLRDPSTPQWRIDTIKKNRIKYFQLCGIHLGEDYEAYEQSEEARKKRPTQERIERFEKTRKKAENDFNNEFYTSTVKHQEARREIASLGLLNQDDGLNASIYTLPCSTFVNPNLRKTEDGYEQFSIVALQCNYRDGSRDHDIIHEMNHVFELCLKEVDEKKKEYEYICGWDASRCPIVDSPDQEVDTLTPDTEKRSYELFSEIINEVIAQEIYRGLLEEGHHIFDTEENARVKGTTSYEHTFFLVKDFYEEFKKEIIESRSNGNIQIIWDEVGKENFDELNKLFHIYYENFSGMKIYSLLNSLKNGEDTNQTRVYKSLLEKRDEILAKMRKHSMLKKETTKKGSIGTTKKD